MYIHRNNEIYKRINVPEMTYVKWDVKPLLTARMMSVRCPAVQRTSVCRCVEEERCPVDSTAASAATGADTRQTVCEWRRRSAVSHCAVVILAHRRRCSCCSRLTRLVFRVSKSLLCFRQLMYFLTYLPRTERGHMSPWGICPRWKCPGFEVTRGRPCWLVTGTICCCSLWRFASIKVTCFYLVLHE